MKGIRLKMKKILKSKNLWILIISIVTTICYSVNVVNGEFRFFGNDFKWILMAAILCILFNKALEQKDKRLYICSVIYSFIISSFAIIGYAAAMPGDFPVGKRDIVMLICKFEATFAFIVPLVVIIIRNIPKGIEKIKNIKEYKFFTANKKSLIAVAGIIFFAYIPYILNYYPGNVLIDSVIQILQGTGAIELTNHHPVLHTLIIGICMKIGSGIFGSYQTGAFIYTILQTLATSIIFSFCIYYMAKKEIPVFFRVLALLFYMFCPTVCFYTITMYKDIPFALMMLLVTIGMTEMCTDTKAFFNSKKKIALLTIAVFIAMFFRNNGVYAIILTLPFVLIAFRKYYKQILIMFLIPIVLYEIITGPGYKLMGIKSGSTKEALSVPLQQFARLMSYNQDKLSDKQKDKIRQYLPIEDFEKLYDPVFADPIKAQFSEEGFKKDKIGLVKLYFELALEFPTETVKSLVLGSYGYYYPNTVGWGIYTGVNTEQFGKYEDYKFDTNPIVKIGSLDRLNKFVNNRDFPIASMVLSVGFLFWLILGCITYLIYKKKYKKIIIFLPVLFVWFTALASPVFCEPRYVYSIFTCLPLFIGIAVNNKENLI